MVVHQRIADCELAVERVRATAADSGPLNAIRGGDVGARNVHHQIRCDSTQLVRSRPLTHSANRHMHVHMRMQQCT